MSEKTFPQLMGSAWHYQLNLLVSKSKPLKQMWKWSLHKFRSPGTKTGNV